MAMSLTQQLIRIKDEYRKVHGTAPVSARTMYDWALETGRAKLDLKKAETQAVAEFAAALAAETAIDINGNVIRANLAFETKQGWLWDEWDTISHENMELNVAHNRRNIYGEIKSVVLNINAFNELHADEAPIQFSLNFEADLADDGIPMPSDFDDLDHLVEAPPPVLADAPEPPEARPPSSKSKGTNRQRSPFFRKDVPPPPADSP